MYDFSAFDIEAIARRCAEETQKFLRHIEQDTRYCFELWRRALAEQLDDALQHLYLLYIPLLAGRARRHKQFAMSCADGDYFARIALANFYRACHGARFTDMFPELAPVMKYLNACLHSAIVQDVRDNPLTPPLPEDDSGLIAPPDPSDHDLRSSDLWEHIRSVLDDSRDEALSYKRFVLQMTPAEIMRADQGLWQSTRDISVALQRIRRKLRKDDTLRGLFGL
ncbi:MAG: sigma-70 family RNA polymerase sigma factor [Anaerolineae bacterium]|nr:sigma-70 family RNA polymerase sigma factor [Anaerolineae bacterium]